MADQNLLARVVISAEDKASSVFNLIKNNAASIVGAITGYFSARFFERSIDDAAAFEEQMGILQNVIDATGSAAGLTTQDIEAMARRLGDPTEMRAAAAELLTFKSVGKETFETTLSLARDLAVAGFGSIQSNAVQLGKALEDPVNGLNALARSGVTFSASEKAMIASLVESGDKLKAQGIILDALAGQVGGADEGAGKGLIGAMDSLRESVLYLREEFGSAFLPVLTKVYNGVADFFGQISNSGVVTQFTGAMTNGFAEAQVWAQKFITSVDFSGIQAGAGAFFGSLKSLVGEAIDLIGELIGAIAGIAKSWEETGSLQAFGDLLKNVLSVGSLLIEGVVSALKGLFTALADSGAINSFSSAMSGALTAIVDLAKILTQPFLELFGLLNDTSPAQGFGAVLGQVLAGLADAAALFVNSLSAGINALSAGFNGLAGVGAKVMQVLFDGVASLEGALSKVTFGEVSKKWQTQANEAKAVAEAFGESARQNFDKAGKAIDAMVGSGERVIGVFKNVYGEAKTVGEAVNELGVQADEAGNNMQSLSAQSEQAASSLNTVKNQSKETGAAITALNTDLSKLNNEQMKALGVTLQQAFAAGKISAEELDAKLKQIADQSLKNIGVGYEEIKRTAKDFAISAVDAYQAAAQGGEYNKAQLKEIQQELVKTAKNADDLKALEEAFRAIGIVVDDNTDKLQNQEAALKGTAQSSSSLDSSLRSINDASKNASNSLNVLSDSAVQSAHSITDAADSFTTNWNDYTQKVTSELDRMNNLNLAALSGAQKSAIDIAQRKLNDYLAVNQTALAEKAQQEAVDKYVKAVGDLSGETVKTTQSLRDKNQAIKAQLQEEQKAQAAFKERQQEEQKAQIALRDKSAADKEQQKAQVALRDKAVADALLAEQAQERKKAEATAARLAEVKARQDQSLTAVLAERSQEERRSTESVVLRDAARQAQLQQEREAENQRNQEAARLHEEALKAQRETTVAAAKSAGSVAQTVRLGGNSDGLVLNERAGVNRNDALSLMDIQAKINAINGMSLTYSSRTDLLQSSLNEKSFAQKPSLDRDNVTDRVVVSFQRDNGPAINSSFQSRDQAMQFIELLKQAKSMAVSP